VLIDRARIFVKAGNGGNGAVSFRREKFVPKGGPDGGDGGRGGDVRLRVRPNVSSLLAFQYNQHFLAKNGGPGEGGHRHGKSAPALHVDVPPGTVVYDDATGQVVADLTEPDVTFTVAKGGRGGLGNAHFKSSVRQAPRLAELGEPGEERWIRLELRIIADVGLVGMPNAGKSTLLAAASAARPKIANYPFTTVEPNLGVVQLGGPGGQTYVLADVPGLIEGAAEGAGLGHEFLRHITRTKALVHVVDASGGLEGRDPLVDFETIMQELRDYDARLLERPMLVALNKVDVPEARDNLPRLRAEIGKGGYRIFEISAATGEGVQPLLNEIGAVLREIAERPAPVVEEAPRVYTLDEADEQAFHVRRTGESSFEVTGAWIERVTRMTNFDLPEAVERYQKTLDGLGISRELEAQGIETGDTVTIAGHELTWGDLEALEPPVPRRRTAAERYANRKSRAAE
jgi:GTP-binding protein